MPDHLYNCLIDNLLDRRHATKFYDLISRIAEINASVVQGSGVGPSEFDVGLCASRGVQYLHWMMHKCIIVKVGGNEIHVKYVKSR